eukprot:COSAG01_NODE_3466_length_6056_cov_2.539198_5_plen_53_part_00
MTGVLPGRRRWHQREMGLISAAASGVSISANSPFMTTASSGSKTVASTKSAR